MRALHLLCELASSHDNDRQAIDNGPSDALVPVATVGESKTLMSIGEVNSFLAEQKRTMTAKCAELAEVLAFPFSLRFLCADPTANKVFPRDEKLVTMAEAAIQLTLLHAAQIAH